jgi:excisionase family DNA binding protein
MPLLTQDEVAAILRCQPNTVARLRRAGKLPYIAMRPVKIRSEDLDRWIAKNTLRAREGVRAGRVAPEKHPAQKAHEEATRLATKAIMRQRIRRMTRG